MLDAIAQPFIKKSKIPRFTHVICKMRVNTCLLHLIPIRELLECTDYITFAPSYVRIVRYYNDIIVG
jgi:hypothetical protein